VVSNPSLETFKVLETLKVLPSRNLQGFGNALRFCDSIFLNHKARRNVNRYKNHTLSFKKHVHRVARSGHYNNKTWKLKQENIFYFTVFGFFNPLLPNLCLL